MNRKHGRTTIPKGVDRVIDAVSGEVKWSRSPGCYKSGISVKDRLLKDYRDRIEYYDDLIQVEQDLLSKARQQNDPEKELAMRRSDIRSYNELRQLCVQVTRDLEDL